MQSHSNFLRHHYPSRHRRLNASRKQFPRFRCRSRSFVRSCTSYFCYSLKLHRLIIQQYRCCGQRNAFRTKAFDEDSFDVPVLDDWGAGESSPEYLFSSSDEDSDGEVVLTPVSDIDLPTVSVSNNDALTVTAHRLATIVQDRKRHTINHGIFITMGLVIFLTVLLLYVDCCAWRIVRLPLAPFYLTRPFLISLILVSFAGYVCVPLFRGLRILHVVRKEGPVRHGVKRRTPTMGALFFIPIGVIVARVITGLSSIELSGATGATLAFAAIGLLGDMFSLMKNHNSRFPELAKFLLEVAVGMWFSFWMDIANISSPYGMKMLVPLPLGLVYLGRYYQLLTPFCFVSMGNAVKLTDGLDGMAGGIAALAFTGMSIAVLPICSDLAIFGASMAGSCVGFLLHNRYKASIIMGDTGSLALGGALAAMAACTGMFFPLVVSSGIFVVEASSVIIQVLYFKITKGLHGAGRRFFRMAPFHHHLQQCGFSQPIIVADTVD
ncbi:hypothetical protein L6164_035471 [Bauhinia variegata]|uniref:Uncharacterized protein n=1 Tax=Bauhinia variegata TaxID=167791 RepID=A0ACB9KE39_BAUVA|nr:hypothetical protein L6164_035471 [Bauhinia variegata]